MPCACNIPTPNAPTNEIWGPIFWKLLHTLAERVGSTMIDLYKSEEKLTWINLIKNTEKVLPCVTCREHYNDWLKRNNPNILKTFDSVKMNIWIRNFFWALHQEVNTQNKKEGLPFESLSTLYKNININKNMRELEPIMKIVFQHNGVSIIAWESWKNQFKKLQGIYGL